MTFVEQLSLFHKNQSKSKRRPFCLDRNLFLKATFTNGSKVLKDASEYTMCLRLFLLRGWSIQDIGAYIARQKNRHARLVRYARNPCLLACRIACLCDFGVAGTFVIYLQHSRHSTLCRIRLHSRVSPALPSC